MIHREQKVHMLCGSTQFTLANLNHTMIIAECLLSTPHTNISFIREAQQDWTRVQKLSVLRRQGQQPTFLEALQIFRLTECQDPRDKVYAPLGLFSDAMMQIMSIDYEQSVHEVYLNAMKCLMSQAGHELDFLSYAVRLNEPVQESSTPIAGALPTWIPDWRLKIDLMPLPKILHGLEAGIRAIRPYDRRGVDFRHDQSGMRAYNACGGARASAVIVDTALSVEGVFCDDIAEIMPLSDVVACRDIGRR